MEDRPQRYEEMEYNAKLRRQSTERAIQNLWRDLRAPRTERDISQDPLGPEAINQLPGWKR